MGQMKRRNFITLLDGAAARRRYGRSRRMRSSASACGAIGVLMPHAQDNPVDLFVSRRCCRS